MRRRVVIAGLVGAAAWPSSLGAQQPRRLPTIGYIGGSSIQSRDARNAAFFLRLRELGWRDSENVTIEYRWSEGRADRLTEIAAEFVRLKVDVIFAVGTEAALAAKRATTTIPIVFPLAVDPVGSGLVASLARPGGNVTGLSNQARDLGAKRMELLHEVLPRVRRVAFLANAAHAAGRLELGEVNAAARLLGLGEVLPVRITRPEDIAPAFTAISGLADALYIVGDPLVYINRFRLNALALEARLPTIYSQRDYVEGGGLMSYGPSYIVLSRRAAEYVDKILRGTRPSDIPVEQPTRFELVINLKTAKALGIEVPPMLLARADEVIE